jgi:restriction endonuclease S subunit
VTHSTVISSGRMFRRDTKWTFEYFDPEFRQYLAQLPNPTSLGSLITGIRYGASLSPDYSDTGTLFIRAQNIREYGIDLSDVRYIPEGTPGIERYRLEEGDLLITRSGVNVGDAAVITSELAGCIHGSYSIKVRLNRKKILPRYAAIVLNSEIGQRQVAVARSRSAQPNINTSELRRITIPLLSLSVQEQITAAMQGTYAARQTMLAEAGALREGVDEYVLSELGIKWDVIPDVRRFVVSSEELLGGRFDAGHQSPQAEQALKLLKESGHTVVQLGDIIETIHYGASIKNEYFDEGIPFIRIGNLKPNELDTSDIVFLSETVRKQIGKAFVETGDLLMSRSGSVGIVACVPPDADGFAFGSYQIKFRLKAGAADPKYIAYVLNSPLGMVQTQQQKTGAVQMNITIPGIKAIRVPIPDAGVQEHIVEAADNMRLKAAELQHEAEAVVTRAKVKVERMILEEDSDGVE